MGNERILLEMPENISMDIMHKLFYEGRDLLRTNEPSNLIIYMPKYFNEILVREIYGTGTSVHANRIDVFRGIKVVGNYQNKVVLAHVDSILLRLDFISIDIP